MYALFSLPTTLCPPALHPPSAEEQNQHGTVRTTAGHSTDARGRVRRAALPTWDPNKRTQMLSEQHSPVTLHQAHRANRPLSSHTLVRKCPARPSTAPMRRPRARQALHKQAHTGGGARGVLHALLEQLSFGRMQANCSRQTLLLMTQHRTSPARKPSASRCPSAPFEMLTECNPLSCLLRPTFRPKRTSNSTSNTTGKMAWRTAALPTALEGAFAKAASAAAKENNPPPTPMADPPPAGLQPTAAAGPDAAPARGLSLRAQATSEPPAENASAAATGALAPSGEKVGELPGEANAFAQSAGETVPFGFPG